MLNVVGKRKIFYGFSLALIGAGIFSIIFWGLHFGIDFRGGSLIEIDFLNGRPEASAIKSKIAALDLGEAAVQPVGDNGVIIRMKDLDEAAYQKVLQSLNTLSPIEEKRFDSVGPVIGGELKQRAYLAISLVLILIIIYIALAFRKVSRPWLPGNTAWPPSSRFFMMFLFPLAFFQF